MPNRPDVEDLQNARAQGEKLIPVSEAFVIDDEVPIGVVCSKLMIAKGMRDAKFVNPVDNGSVDVEGLVQQAQRLDITITDINYVGITHQEHIIWPNDGEVLSLAQFPHGIQVGIQLMQIGKPVIFITGNDENQAIIRKALYYLSNQTGVTFHEGRDFAFFQKPLDHNRLFSAVCELLYYHQERTLKTISLSDPGESELAKLTIETLMSKAIACILGSSYESGGMSLYEFLEAQHFELFPYEDRVFMYQRLAIATKSQGDFDTITQFFLGGGLISSGDAFKTFPVSQREMQTISEEIERRWGLAA